MSDVQQDLIDAISGQISRYLSRQKMEEHHPQFDPDRMDDIIKHAAFGVALLRRVREELEDFFNTPEA